MTEAREVTGMVLLAAPVGDFDKRLVLLTREYGKITVFARGARKPNSAFLAVANPFVFGTFFIYEGRTSYQLKSARIKNYFTELTKKQPGVYYGFYFLELASYYYREYMDATEMLNLLYVTLRALTVGKMDNRLIRCVFELRAVLLNGECPDFFSCQECCNSEQLFWFYPAKAGVVCESCHKKTKGYAIKMDASVLYTVQYIVTSKLQKLYTFTVTEEVLETLCKMMKEYMKGQVDREFKSLEVLRVMEW